MNKTYITIIILIVLAAGAALIFGMGRKTEAPTITTPTPMPTSPTACTMDAKICPDGSAVGRIGPNCEFAACPSAPITTTASVKEFTITGKNFSFSPSTITVKKGDRVKITFKNSQGFHDFVIDEYGVATKQASSPATEVLEFTADKVGSFEYYCSVGTHRAMGMLGTLKVE